MSKGYNFEQLKAFHRASRTKDPLISFSPSLRVFRVTDKEYAIGYSRDALFISVHEDGNVSFHRVGSTNSEKTWFMAHLPEGLTYNRSKFTKGDVVAKKFPGITFNTQGEQCKTFSEMRGVGTPERKALNKLIIDWRRKAVITLKLLGISDAGEVKKACEALVEKNKASLPGSYHSFWQYCSKFPLNTDDFYQSVSGDVTPDNILHILIHGACIGYEQKDARKTLDVALNKYRDDLSIYHQQQKDLEKQNDASNDETKEGPSRLSA